MTIDTKVLLKFLSPRIVAKAVMTTDKSTALVVSVCWAAAFVVLILAVYAVHGAASAKKDAEAALVAEPVLPVARTTPIGDSDVQVAVDRMQSQFPDIKFEAGPDHMVVIKSNDGARFHQWISALSYIDSMSPQLHWTLDSFCVGNCRGTEVMKATVAGVRITFSLPQT